MLTIQELIQLPYTPDLSEGGIAHACQVFARSHLPAGGSPVDRLRRIAARTAVDLAFRHTLNEQNIPFHVLNAAQFSDPKHYDVLLGGHRCDLISYIISRPQQIAAVQTDPGILLEAQALIPVEKFTSQEYHPNDIQMFAFLFCGEGGSSTNTGELPAAAQPAYWIHPLPGDWARPKGWEPLSPVVLKSECPETLTVQMGGMDAERNYVTATVQLAPRTRTPVEQAFYSIAFIHAKEHPTARLGISSPVRGAAYIISPHAWDDLWMHGRAIWLAGWLTHDGFRYKSSVLKVGAGTFQFDHTRVKNLSVPVKELNPCGPLFRRVKDWAAEQTGKTG